MLDKVTIIFDNTDPDSHRVFENVEDVGALLVEQFEGSWPEDARVYHGNVCQGNDVTPTCPEEVERLLGLEGELYVVVFPGYAAIPYIVAVVLAVAAYVLAPSPVAPPVALNRNQQAPSANNELSDRSNRARINGRIPDIYGTVRSTPDLIAAPYKVFENNRRPER